MTGVIATLGYRNEKKRFVEDPRKEKRTERHHMRGVLIDRVVSSVGRTDARTISCGESSPSSGSRFKEVSSSSLSNGPACEPPLLELGVLFESFPSISPGIDASDTPKRPSKPVMSIAPSWSSDLLDGCSEGEGSFDSRGRLFRLVSETRRSLWELVVLGIRVGDSLRLGVEDMEPYGELSTRYDPTEWIKEAGRLVISAVSRGPALEDGCVTITSDGLCKLQSSWAIVNAAESLLLGVTAGAIEDEVDDGVVDS